MEEEKRTGNGPLGRERATTPYLGISHNPLRVKEVGREGFEPSYTYVIRFTEALLGIHWLLLAT